MEDSHPETIPHGCFFVYKGYRQTILSLYATTLGEVQNSPYLLDTLNNIGKLLIVEGKRVALYLYYLPKELTSNSKQSGPLKSTPKGNFLSNEDQNEVRNHATMVRVSECKYFVASVFPSNIRIEKSEMFIEQRVSNEKSLEAEFQLEGARSTYVEWPPLNPCYIEKPYFLTLDDKGNLMIHEVYEKNEQIIGQGEIFRCATFSLGGREIYAINDKQEICKIDLENFSLVNKITIKELSDPEGIKSSHIKQVTPWTFAIGSLRKVKNERNKWISEPCLHIISGDISDQKEELKIQVFKMPIKSEYMSPSQSVIFSSLYIKERQLLLFGHTGSGKVLALNFEFDGSISLKKLKLGDTNFRGMVIAREKMPAKGQKNEDEVNYHQKTMKLSNPPSILLLDSKGNIHAFRYYDTRCSSPILSMSIKPFSNEDYQDRQKLLKGRMIIKKRVRCKSQNPKNVPCTWRKNRSKSEARRGNFPLETKIPPEEKQRKLEELKKSNIPKKTLAVEPSSIAHNLFKKPKNPFTSVEKDNESASSSLFSQTSSSLFKKTENLFTPSVKKTEEKFAPQETKNPTKSSLFSSSGSSLFGSSASNKPCFSFQKPISKEEAGNSLFSSTKKADSGLNSANLFSSNISEKTLVKVFTTTEDPIKKKAFLFLNKIDSDILFKVEKEEFPAHKYILSEKCKFFKNMFASGMLESYSSVITVPETKASIFKAFMEYVYLGKTVMNEEIALNLVDLAEKYIIDELKVACENFLPLYLTVENCMKIFEAACLYDISSLREKTLFFFQINSKKILEKHNLQDLPKLSHICFLKVYWRSNPILGPSLSELIVNKY